MSEQLHDPAPRPIEHEVSTRPSTLPEQLPVVSIIASFCAAGLLGCFFLPWVNLLFIKPSGFNLAMEGGNASVLWALPFFSLVTVLGAFVKQGRVVAAITGLLPFFALAAGLHDVGRILLDGLEPGAWGSLVFGFMLVILASRLK